MPELLQADTIVKRYGKGPSEFTALQGVSLTVDEGESLAIVGKSGSGKSTLMHLLALLDQPTSGVISIRGVEVSKLKRQAVYDIRNNEFGFVFQQFFLNANDSVLDNVVLPLKIAGVAARERKPKGMAVLEAVELADKAKNKAATLSGGQKQRVAIARAIINNPSVIFADEPTGNLDSITGKKIENILFNLNKSTGITLVIVTHDEDLANRCNRKLYIKDGQVDREGEL